MGKCPFVDRDCTTECVAFKEGNELSNCIVIQKADRTTMLLNYIEKKIDRLLEK